MGDELGGMSSISPTSNSSGTRLQTGRVAPNPIAPEVGRVKQPQRYRFSAGVQDLRPGQILMGDVVTTEGTLLVAAGKALTETVVERLRNFAQIVGVREPIEIESRLPKPV